jgi:pimeloyl-ACP methyl ester carboxylesterase
MQLGFEIFRTRFARDIVAEFIPPVGTSNKVAILSSGAPGYPGGKRELMEMLSKRGYWAIVPRYRGTWESDGTFLEFPPSEDIKLIMDEVSVEFTDLWSGTEHRVHNPEFHLLGGSFGGPSAVLNSADPRVKKAVAISSVVDWREQVHTVEPLALMNEFVPKAFGMAYRAGEDAWQKLAEGNFYNPVTKREAVDGAKLLFIHAADDRVVHAAPARTFAKEIGAQYVELSSGGHMGVGKAHEPQLWKHIEKFLKTK